MNEILQYLKTHGEQLDTAIAAAMGTSLATTHLHLSELAASNKVVACHTTRFDKGKKIEGISCRIAGFTPKAAPGRKSTRVNLKLS